MMGIFKVFPVKGFSLFTMFLRVCLKAFNVLAKNNYPCSTDTHTQFEVAEYEIAVQELTCCCNYVTFFTVGLIKVYYR